MNPSTVYPRPVIEYFSSFGYGEVQQITEAGQLRVWFEATTWFARLDKPTLGKPMTECPFQPGEKVRIVGMEDSTTLLVAPITEDATPRNPRNWFDWLELSDNLAYV